MKLLPVILGVVGLAGGIAAGHFLKPAEEKKEMAAGDAKMADGEHHEEMAKDSYDDGKGGEHAASAEQHEEKTTEELLTQDFIKLSKQFVVPIVEDDRVGSLIVISMAIEADQGFSDIIFQYEPKIRDEFLSVLFKHAQSGGFHGVFTADQPMHDLRSALLNAARNVLGTTVKGVLVTDIVRQDI